MSLAFDEPLRRRVITPRDIYAQNTPPLASIHSGSTPAQHRDKCCPMTARRQELAIVEPARSISRRENAAAADMTRLILVPTNYRRFSKAST
jgi:hypothetical protein